MPLAERLLNQLRHGPSFKMRLAMGLIPGFEQIHKFGRDAAAGTTERVIATNIANTVAFPPLGAGGRVRVKAGGDAADTIDGTGLRKVVIAGIEQTTREHVTVELNTAGAGASEWSEALFHRVNRVYGTECGSSGYNVAGVTIEHENVGDAVVVEATRGQSQIGHFTVPKGYVAFLATNYLAFESGKTPTIRFYQRGAVLDGSVLYSRRLVQEWPALAETIDIDHATLEAYDQYTDIWYTAQTASGSARVDCEFELYLVARSIVNATRIFDRLLNW